MKPRTFTTADGAAGQAGWFDTERGEVCQFRDLGGKLLCVPRIVTTATRYSDPECKQAVYFEDSGADALFLDENGAGVWRGGGQQITESSLIYRVLQNGSCGAAGGDIQGYWMLVDASGLFVQATVD